MKFNVKINLDPAHESVKVALKFGQFMYDSEILKDSNFFIPMDESFLMKSGQIHSKLGEGLIIWQTPYARRLYYNPQYKFSTDVNPHAQGLWYEAAKAKNAKKWVNVAQKAVDSKL